MKGSGKPEPTKQARAVECLDETIKDAKGNIQVCLRTSRLIPDYSHSIGKCYRSQGSRWTKGPQKTSSAGYCRVRRVR